MKKLVALILVVAFALSLVGCTAQPASSTPAAGAESGAAAPAADAAAPADAAGEQIVSAKDTLVIAVNADHGNLNQVESVGNNADMLRSLCANRLVDFYRDENGGVQVGICDRGLATEYAMDDDNMGVTMKLREGVLFQNGVEFKASDVAFSLGFYKEASGHNYIDFDNIKVIDDYTIYIPFTRVYSSAVKKLSVVCMWSEAYWNEVGGDTTVFFHDAPIGTGAFQITEYATDDRAVLVRNDNYYEGAAVLKNIIVRFIKENATAFAELETGGVDYVFTPDGTDIKNVQDGAYGDEIALYSALKEDALLLGYNGYTPEFQDIRVRQAISYAFDRSSMVAIYDGAATDMYTITSNMPGTMTEFKPWFYEQNLEKAGQLLDEAGYTDTDGDGLREDANGEDLSFVYLYIGTSPQYTAIGEIMKNNLASIGVTLEMGGYDVATYSDMMKNDVHAWDIYEMQLGSVSSASGWNYVYEDSMKSTAHIDQYPNYQEYMDKWITPLNEELDEDAWWAKFREFEKVALTDYLYWYPLCQRLDISAYNSKLQNFDRITWQAWNLTKTYFEA